MNEAQVKAAALWDQLVSAESGRRVDTLFYPISDEKYYEWMFVMGRHFRDALDMKFTPKKIDKKETKVWTQGSNFSVKEGYLFQMVGKDDWWLQVIEAVPAVAAGKNRERDKGYVKYQIIIGAGRTAELYEATQDDFVRILIDWKKAMIPLSQDDARLPANEDCCA